MPRDDVVVAVIEAIAKSDGENPAAVEYNLSEYIDPTALERLGDMEDGVWELSFRVSDHHVQLRHDETIFVDGVKYEPDTAVQE